MENTINHSPGWVPQVRRAPPLGAAMKESSEPTLATTIAELVRLGQLAEAANKDLPPYNKDNVGDKASSPPG